MCVVSVAGIVLAAGFSRRLGRSKQNVMIAGETLLQRTLRIAHAAQLKPVIVVVQSGIDLPEQIQASAFEIVLNTEAEEGIASSIRAGIHAVAKRQGIQGAVLMTCDQVGMNADHLRALYAMPDRLTGSRYANKTAVPAYFPHRDFDELLQLRGDTGARGLLSGAYAITAEDLGLDVDTEEDVERARQFLHEPP
ncbi:MAG: nucleotidyltransferase family protein [Janthinobacterium lividum]